MDAMAALADPTRRRIVELLADGDMPAGEIAAQFEVSWSAISQHLSVLKAAGFVVERRVGTSRMYRTDQAALGSLRSIVEEHWRGSLNRIKDLAEAEQRDKDRS